MTRPVIYSQLDRLLRALGFQVASSERTSQVYQHPESGAVLVLAKRRSTEPVPSADLLSVRRHLVERGLLADDIFQEFAATGEIPVNK